MIEISALGNGEVGVAGVAEDGIGGRAGAAGQLAGCSPLDGCALIDKKTGAGVCFKGYYSGGGTAGGYHVFDRNC